MRRRPLLLIAALLAALACQITAGTAAFAGQAAAGRFDFAVISDSRSGDRVFAKIVDQLVRRGPGFVVHVGDIMPTYCRTAQWEEFKRLVSPIKVPIYIAPGNHDIEDAKSKACWKRQVDFPGEETYFSFTRGRNLFVILSSNEPDSEFRVEGAQLAWLRRTLDPKKYDNQFVFVHHPLFLWKGAFHEGEAMDRYPAQRDELHRLFVERGVKIVFTGHEHTYRRMDKDGVRYMVVGGAGSPLYSGFHHFVMVGADGPFVQVKVIDKEGLLRDEFSLGPIIAPSGEKKTDEN